MSSVLFVADEASLSEASQRSMLGSNEGWETLFAESGERALALLDEHRIDVVVTDMHMSGIDGADFLARVKEKDASIGRLLLSQHADEDAALRSTSVAHRYLAKPCDGNQLNSVLQSMLSLRSTMEDVGLQQLVGELGALPSLSENVRALVDECMSPDADLQLAASVVEQDPAMAAKILQLVNSAFFGLPREVHSIRNAVTLLGLKTITALALSTHAFAAFDASDLHPVARRAASSGLNVAGLAQAFAAALGFDRDLRDDAFQAGLLHDIGVLALAVRRPVEFQRCVHASVDTPWRRHEMEKMILGGDHGAVGGFLLGLWGLPENVVEAVSFHHISSPDSNEERGLAFCVFMASVVDSLGTDVALSDCYPELEGDETVSMLLALAREKESPAD